MQTPIEKDGSFDLRRLPPGTRIYGTTGTAGTGARTIVAGANPQAISWSYGQNLDVILRAKQFDAGAHVWVIKGQHAVKTQAELDALAASAADVASSRVERIGASNTDAGRDIYRAGDRHAVITGNYPVPYTVCARATASAPVGCKVVTAEPTIGIEYSDRRYGAGVTPILFEL
jgi:hypothetical protein